ncbi:hypothetical protein [Succinimonas amylolytica]|uniref:hypothetical protein n=1 Tax=Succinimonas amylolytica TaxID=83769 RepID=UPI0023A85C15
MANIIGMKDDGTAGDSLSMSNQGTDSFLQLLIDCALAEEMTASQLALTEFFEERKYVNGYAPGTVSFDIDEMPWDASCMQDDAAWLQQLLKRARDPALWKISGKPEDQIVFQWLDQFVRMAGRFCMKNGRRSLGSGGKKAGIYFKKGTGWKACRDEGRNIFTAERSWRGFYELRQIDRDTYDRLGTELPGDETPISLIRKGRQLAECDDDYYACPYIEIRDENYAELAPWADVHRRRIAIMKQLLR